MPTKVSASLQLTGAFQTVHTVDSHRWLTVSNIHLTNTSNSAATIRMCFVAPGSSASEANAVLWDFSLDANDFLEYGEGVILFPNWTIQALASALTSITVHVFGIEDV